MTDAVITHIYNRNVWIESDIAGAKHVMIQHDDGISEPFCFASFHYDHRYTDNASVHRSAEKMALSLGATLPVTVKQRPFSFEALQP